MDKKELSDVVAIKKYFELGGGAKVSIDEMRKLEKAERSELGKLCRIELKNLLGIEQRRE